MSGGVGEAQAVHGVVASVFGDDGAVFTADHEVGYAEFAETILIADLHELELEAGDRFGVKLALGDDVEGLRIVRISPVGEVEDASVTDLPGFVFGGESFGGEVEVFGNHLSGKEIDVVSEITIFFIVEEEDAAHADVFEIAKTEIGDPEIRISSKGVAQRIVHSFEHIVVSFKSDGLLEDPILIEIGVRKFFHSVFFFLIRFRISIVKTIGVGACFADKTDAHRGDPADQRF